MPTWTPLITSTMFDGIRVDVTTAVTGVLSIALIVFGAMVIFRAINR